MCACVVDVVVQEQNMDHLKDGNPEQSVSSMKRFFMDNMSYTISTLSDIHCKNCCYIYKKVYKMQNIWESA